MTKSALRQTATSPATGGEVAGPGLAGGVGWVLALILGLTCAVYLQTLGFGFVNYDDPDYVSANPRVLGGLTWENLKWGFTAGHASNWHPLTWVSHMLDVGMFSQWAGGHHAVNVVLHLLNTGLVFVLFRAMTGRRWFCVFLAGLFALHPLRVESVAWISERKDVLSGFFFLLTLWAYAGWAKASKSGDGRRAGCVCYGFSLGAYACGLMSKPMLVTVPFLLLLLDYWPLNRLEKSGPIGVTRLLVEKIPFLVMAVASSTVTYLVQKQGGAVSTALPLAGRVENALLAYVRYLWKLVWPADLSVLYPHPGHWPLWAAIGSAAFLVGVTGVVLWSLRARPYLCVGWFWFLGTMVPVIGLVQVGIQSMADRYTYIPMIGLTAASVWLVGEWAEKKPVPRRVAVGAVGVLMLAWAGLTFRQTGYWRTSLDLFTHAVQVTRDNYLAWNNLGFWLSEQGKLAEALTHYQKSLRINPNYEEALNNYGHALAGLHRHAEALPYYERALSIRPTQLEVRNNLGNSLAELGRSEEAIAHYRYVLERKPDHADALNNLGIALAMKGEMSEAIECFERAIQARPGYAGAYGNLGNALAAQRKLPEAMAHYQKALQLNPDDSQTHNNLANVLSDLGRGAEAVNHYQRALALTPENPGAHFNLGMALLRLGKSDAAGTHFREALRFRPDYNDARRQLELLDQEIHQKTQP